MNRALPLAVCLLLSSAVQAGEPPPPPAPERAAELTNILIQDCGSCHGLRLNGGLGPPLVPEALAGKPTELLTATILYGRAGTAMPPWHPFFTEAEVAWIVDGLQQGSFLQ